MSKQPTKAKPRGNRLGAPNKSNPLRVGAASFTQREIDYIRACIDGTGIAPGAIHGIVVKKILLAKPTWSPNVKPRLLIFRFAYAEGICKL